ncbi:MAG TPA: apolipoprotein N-acyltransferase [Bacteroidia bacterium]|nr:apolipoprotein N-acyltransferase [Bacteroidia bacterium]
MGFFKKTGLALLTGLLLGASWFSPFTFLIFIAFVPLLILTEDVYKNAKRPKGSVFFYAYIAFVTWNAIVTWWTWFASPGGSVFAITANALLMAFAYWIFFILYRSFQKSTLPNANRKLPSAYWLLIPVWLSFEYLHTQWDLAWTWLTLGNVLSAQHNWVQWYEFTGVSGGSLWILAVNVLIYRIAKGQNSKIRIVFTACIVLIPILLSYVIKPSNLSINKSSDQHIVIVQPNIDPYEEKFFIAYETQLNMVYEQIKGKITDKTNYLVLPETFFTENIWENEIERSNSIRFFRDSILKKYPNLIIITGASTLYRLGHEEKLTATARKFSDADEYYDSFNTGLQLDNFEGTQIYHKSKLVPGVERMPYPAFFKPLEKLTIDLGGTSGSLGTQDERGVFFNKDKTIGVAPVICYESVFGEYVTDYINKGANLIFIITNDGWWRDSPGYRQHLDYARLRAIETRCPIARCANTGISCFIDETGELSQATKWWEPAVISGDLSPNNKKTFYTRFGDLTSKAALLLGLVAVLWAIIRRFKK